MQTTFLRVLSDEEKGTGLQQSVEQINQEGGDKAFLVDPDSFHQVPGSPFAYWVSERIRKLFVELPPFESEGRAVKVGLQTSDDFRFVRAWWEVPPEKILDAQNGPEWREDIEQFQEWCRNRTKQGKKWVPFAKGGEYSPFYADIHLVVNWADEGYEMKSYSGSVIRNEDYYFRPGITWPERTTSRYAPQYLPAGVIFSHVGLGAFPRTEEDTHWTLLLHNSKITQYLVELIVGAGDTAARHYTSGVLGKLPFGGLGPNVPVGKYGRYFWSVNGFLRMSEGSSLEFDQSLVHDYITSLDKHTSCLVEKIITAYRYWSEIEDTTRAEFGLRASECKELALLVGPDPSVDYQDCAVEDPRSLMLELLSEHWKSTSALISHCKAHGLSGRWITKNLHQFSRFAELIAHRYQCDVIHMLTILPEIIEYETADFSLPYLSFSFLVGLSYGRFSPGMTRFSDDPLDPLCTPVSEPSEEHLSPNAPGNSETECQDLGSRMLNISTDGILVDDSADDCDLILLLRDAILKLGADDPQRTEFSICTELGVESLRQYLRKTGKNGFWDQHIKQYSKSRRKAPIYWQLSIPSSQYSVWLYYHRFNKDTLFKVLSEHLVPKVQAEERKLDMLRREYGPKPTTGQSEEISEQEDFVDELRWMREELEMVAPLWDPDLDDGVELNFAPLWRVVPHNRSWQKHLKKRWDELCSGKYDWSRIAMRLWPERTAQACLQDRSYAIAHGLEDELWVEGESGWRVRDLSEEDIERIISERSSKPVQDALERLLSAPPPLKKRKGRRR